MAYRFGKTLFMKILHLIQDDSGFIANVILSPPGQAKNLSIL